MVQEKFKEIEAQVQFGDSRIISRGGSKGISFSQFAQKLFGRAPAEFISEKSSSELADISAHALSLMEALLDNPSEQKVEIYTNLDYSSIYIAQGDKPFIINTITELFRDQSISIDYLLHPILFHEGYRLSLAYIECEKLSDEAIAILRRKLQNALFDLKIVTEDFTSMLVKAETIARVLRDTRSPVKFPSSERSEVADFLHWLSDGGYIFLGLTTWKCDGDDLQLEPENRLGLFKEESSNGSEILKEAFEDAQKLVESTELVLVSKLRIESSVHRRSALNNIVILECNSDGSLKAAHSIIGLFTSKALSQESSSVPLIRRKLKLLVEKEDLYENSFDFKNTVNIIDSMPKDEAFRLDLDSLREIVGTIVGIQNKNETRVSIRFDPARRGVSLLIIMPRDRFNTRVRDRLQNHLEDTFGARHESSEYHLDLTNKPHARLYFYIPIAIGVPPPVDLAKLEKDIAELSRTWLNNLEDRLLAGSDFENSALLWHQYQSAFSEDYQALHDIEEAVYDIERCESLFASNYSFTFGIKSSIKDDYSSFQLILYHEQHNITLSKSLPILENLGLEVISEQSSRINPQLKTSVNVHRFLVRSKRGQTVSERLFHEKLFDLLMALYTNTEENDILNSLTISAELSVKEVSLLRAYCHFLWQCNKFASREMVYICLSEHPDIAARLFELFAIVFDPYKPGSLEDRREVFKKERSSFRDMLHKVSDITYDRILRSLALLIEHTTRTNFFHAEGAYAFKLHSAEVAILPDPKPLYEIFVYSRFVHGTHLRASKIARGGIRWSDRSEDFRSEVLGLMKTQKMKNSLIVPSGAKGGFVVLNLSNDPAEIKAQVEDAYKLYIRALLSITDNRQGEDIISPAGLLVYDEPDPYFVVAADKGTATFSDLANKIAGQEFNFWLDDAFASGGSQGYDHKKYGITARGAWECVLRHFKDADINYEEEPFTVVGIGDMSGDVFGNGMLLSDKIKLLAGFNHKHIFIDPDPDPDQSFAERKRLFDTPGSQWTDYSSDLISAGGGVFYRFEKAISITPQMHIAFQIPEDIQELNGEKLVSYILRAKCDLLWNGGIGTYVKAASESNADVNDSTNDRVRVNAQELKARVVGEGGNLGFTQRARIEYALRGGRINTDAVDNSAGVDLSDHEVNLKILMSTLETANKITRDERDQILSRISNDVTEHVIGHNRSQSLVLSLGVHRSTRNIAYFRSLIRELHKLNYVQRSLECLPDDDDLLDRVTNKAGLARPELAICLSAVKMFVSDSIIASDFVKSSLVEPYLLEYFPQFLRELYRNEIVDHPLAANIIATQIANFLVDTMGITFVHRMSLTHSIPESTVIKSAVAAQLIMHAPETLQSLQKLDTYSTTSVFLSLRKELNASLRESTAWFFRYHKHDSLDTMVNEYSDRFEALIDQCEDILVGEQLETYKSRMKNYKLLKIEDSLARRMACFSVIAHVMELLWISDRVNISTASVSEVYAATANALGVQALVELGEHSVFTDTYDSELVLNSIEDIKRSLSHITEMLVAKKILEKDSVEKALSASEQFEPFQNLVAEVVEKSSSPSALAIVARNLSQLKL